VAVLGAAPRAAVLAAGWFSYVIYGTVDPSAPYGAAQQSSLGWAGRGLVGLAFDQQFGLIANAPVLALLPFGWWRLSRQNARLATEFLVLTVPYLIVVASFGMWWGGWSAPARFLDAIMPMAVPLMALAWRDCNRAVRGAFVALVLLGVVNIVLRVAVLDGLPSTTTATDTTYCSTGSRGGQPAARVPGPAPQGRCSRWCSRRSG
jgi:hypothetical protein